MPGLPPRAVLQTWKRVDIQRLCKDHGLKANLKTEALIDLLLDVNAPPPRPVPPIRTTSRSSSRTKSRTASVVIHDIEPDTNQSTDTKKDSAADIAEPGPVVVPESAPLPKGRKAKDLQSRLGKGRPVAAGGNGARAVTKSVSRSKRTSRHTQEMESTIPEELEPPEVADMQIDSHIPDETDYSPPIDTTTSVKSVEIPSVPPIGPNELPNRAGYIAPEELETRIMNAIQPLHEQLKQMMAQLDQMQALKAETERLQARIKSEESLQQQVQDLTREMSGLRTQAGAAAELTAEVNRLRDVVTSLESRPILPLTPQFSSTPPNKIAHFLADPPIDPIASTSRQSSNTYGQSPVILGKRRRGSSESTEDVPKADDRLELLPHDVTSTIPNPTRKRPRLPVSDASPKTPANISGGQRLGEDIEDEMPRIPTPRAIARFRVYTDAEAGGGAELGTHLPTVAVPASPTQPRLPRGTSAENDHPFNFTFMPPPTPNFPAAVHNFPVPGPPASPTPANNLPSSGLLTATTRPRNGSRSIVPGPFAPSHTRQRSRRVTQEATGLYANPAALTRVPSASETRAISGSEAATSLGLRRVDNESEGSQNTQPIRGTIFGTELDGDRRFGDFGVEGVASGFWAGRF